MLLLWAALQHLGEARTDNALCTCAHAWHRSPFAYFLALANNPVLSLPFKVGLLMATSKSRMFAAGARVAQVPAACLACGTCDPVSCRPPPPA